MTETMIEAISELSQQETTLIQPDQAYPVWLPYDAVEVADTMLTVLNTATTQDHAWRYRFISIEKLIIFKPEESKITVHYNLDDTSIRG